MMASDHIENEEMIQCWECRDFVPMSQAVADPNGHPLCKPCFNNLVTHYKPVDNKDLI